MSNTKISFCAVDQVGTALKGCQPRIMAIDQAIIVNDTSNIGCQPRPDSVDSMFKQVWYKIG